MNLRSRFFTPISLLLLMVFVLSVFALKILQDFPNSADEYVYLFQAETYASGYLYVDPPPMLKFFSFFHIINREGRYFGIFPFGYPLLLAIGIIIGTPWIINPILGALTIILIYLIARHLFSRRVAILACLLGFFTPFFILNSASYFSHSTCTFFLALTVYSYLKSRGTNRIFWYFMIGASSGFAFITRYLESVAAVIPIGIVLAIKFGRNPKKMSKPCLAVLIGGLIFLASFMAYNHILIGNPLKSPAEYYTITVFSPFSWESLNTGFAYLKEYLTKLFNWTYYLPLCIVPLFFYFFRPKPPSLVLIMISIISLNILGYFFYHIGAGNEYGPRYYYGFYFILPILASYGIDRLLRRKEFIYPLMALILIFNFHSIYEKSATYHQLIFLRRDLYRTVKKSNLNKAIVFLKTSSWDMPPRDLTRNGIKLNKSVIYAHYTNPSKLKQLLKYFPSYLPYSYQFDFTKKEGTIKPLDQ